MSLAEELREAPTVLRHQAREIAAPMAGLIVHLKRHPPALVVTCARGSSAHAATFAKHLIELHLGIPVAAAAPNIASVYRRRLQLQGQLFLTISQSGRSDDLVETAAMAHEAGALTVGMLNDTASPLARRCDVVLPLAAGPERSVAASKSFVASIAAALRLAAAWTASERLAAALDRLPDRVAAAGGIDWHVAMNAIAGAASLVVLGRGPTLSIAREAALKLEEVANIRAEAFSGAEFLHGPIAMVGGGCPVLVLMPTDAAAAGMRRLAAELAAKGAASLIAGDGGLPVLAPDQPETDAICLIQSFYAILPALAARLGIDPDRPRHLQKVTRTR